MATDGERKDSHVVVAGHVNWDVTLRVDRLPSPDDEARIRSRRGSGGGSAANVAIALAGFGVSPSVIGSVGDDEHGRLARDALRQAGVDCSTLVTVANEPTAAKYLLVDDRGEVAVLGTDGVNEAYTIDDVDPSHVRDASHLHLTGQEPETAAALAQVAGEAGVAVSIDPGRRLADRPFDEALSRAGTIFVNDREAMALLSTEYRAVDDGDQVIVVKSGGDGAIVHGPDGSWSHAGFGVEAVDTTGAGDAFAAAFLARRLAGDEYPFALQYANACGALASQVVGPQTAPSAATVDRFLRDRGPDPDRT